MPKLRIGPLGEIGLNSDVSPVLLPPNALTTLRNVSCKEGSLQPVYGDRELMEVGIEPRYYFVWRNPSTESEVDRQAFVVSDGLSVVAYDMDGVAELLVDEAWTGGRVTFTSLNGVLVVNSETDGAWYWAGPGTASLTALPGWDSDWRARQIIAHRYGLFALNMLGDGADGSEVYPHKVRWSNSAEEGSIPTSWDGTDLSLDAGDDILGETQGHIVGGVPSRGFLYIIKEDAIYQARRVDGQFIYAIERLAGTVGTTAPNGFCEMEGAIVVLTSDDVLLFDGQRQFSIADQRVREALATALDDDFFTFSQVLFNPATRLLYAAVVGANNRLTDALVYNLTTQTWSHTKLSNSFGLALGTVTIPSDTSPLWDDLDIPWDELTGTWDAGQFNPTQPQLLSFEGDYADPPTYRIAVRVPIKWTDASGNPKTCIAARNGILIDNAARNWLVRGVWLESDASSPVSPIPTVRLQVGAQDDVAGEIQWATNRDGLPWFDVDLSQDNYIDTRVSGRYLCWTVQSVADMGWRLSALTFDYVSAGER